ncbi:MAG: amidohydrolase family protein [Candidatus Hydrogenedentes bacterium]|nr:amidohydrolase family protein [Candidatus Hydrogenedentota bacterium]
MWRETTKHERNRQIFDEELDAFLPKRILDFHVHVVNEGVLPADNPFHAGGPAIQRYTFEELATDLDECFPGRENSAVCFGIPQVDADHRLNNNYIASRCDNTKFFGLRLLDTHRDDAESVRRDLEGGKLLGLKPYPVYPRKANEADVEIPEMLPDWAMEIVNDLGALVMLHIPRRARLADPLNQRHIVELCSKYPRAKVVLAHIGRAYFYKNVVGNLERLKDLPNLYFDLAMLNSWEVIEYAFRELPAHRILYGSDIPIALAPGKSVEINDQYTYVTPKPWSLSISDDHGKLVFTSFLYEELRAIRKAVERLGLGPDFIEGLFYGNGIRLLRSVQDGSRK